MYAAIIQITPQLNSRKQQAAHEKKKKKFSAENSEKRNHCHEWKEKKMSSMNARTHQSVELSGRFYGNALVSCVFFRGIFFSALLFY